MSRRPAAAHAAQAATAGIYSVRDYGAAGDGGTLDTAAINKAIVACAAAGGGQVRFPPGRYLSGTVHLKSNVALFLDAGATLVGSPGLDQYQHYAAPPGTPEARSPKWHRALILGDGVENVVIGGAGVVDGNKVYDPQGEEQMRGPHTIILGDCKRVTLRDVTVRDSANYAVPIEFSTDVDVRGVKFTGGWDGVHFRGWGDRRCRDLSIVGCQFFTGDDSIAGRYVENLLVTGCVINSSCNGIRVIGPAKHMVVHDCLFYGPGVHPHRTQSRHNMLSGILLQPGAWDESPGALDDVLIDGITMRNVASPVTLWLTRDGNTADGVTVSRLSATGVYRSAASVESWSKTPVGRVVFRDVSMEFEGGGQADDPKLPVKPAHLDSRPLPVWGFYARNAKTVALENVRLNCAKEDQRPVILCEGVERLTLDGLRVPPAAGVFEPLVLRNVGRLDRRDTERPRDNQ